MRTSTDFIRFAGLCPAGRGAVLLHEGLGQHAKLVLEALGKIAGRREAHLHHHLTDAHAAASAYILQGDNLWHPVTTEYTAATIPAYRAYLSLPSASAKNYRFVVVDDATTDIRSIDTNGQSLHGAVYDLQGRKVADDYSAAKYRLASGIYIVNGKKRAIK